MNFVSDQSVIMDYKEDEFNKIEDHEVCWNLDHRGAVGETPLHLLFLMDSYMHTEVGYLILDLYPKLAVDIYEGDEYYGESCLHIAIVYGNFELVKRLVECGANVNQRATGQFFLPEDQKRGKKKKQTNYDGYAYYGEYPLAFACCFGNREMYDYLLDHGADPDYQDSFGNTVLHMAVIANQVEMYKYAFQHHKKPAKPALKNNAKLTPLTLASKLGRHEIFLEMLELSSVVSWHYSNIKCSVYPLAPLDTISPSGNTNWQSALWFIINGETDEHLDMLEGGVIRQLLEEKWKTFAARRFFQRLALALFHLIMVSISVYLRPADKLLQYRGAVDVARYTAEIITVIGCASNTVLSLKEIHSQRFKGFIGNCKHAPAKTIFLVSCILMILCLPCRLLSLAVDPYQCQQVEDTLMIIAVPCAWVFLLFFARSVKLTGPFVTMIYKMCTGDLFRFGIIYAIFLIGFTQGFYFLFRDIEDKSITSFDTLPTTVMTLIQMTLGEFRYQEFDYTHYAFLTKLVFGVFMVFVPILLLNMLIAMMGNTYQQVISKSEKEWRRQSAKIVIVLERAFHKDDLQRYQERYSVKMGSPANEDGEKAENEGHRRGIMVIKACNKTKAKQRKGAVNHWKKFGREVMRQIKEQKKEGKHGPIELKTRKRRSRHKRSRSQDKMDDDRPSSGDSTRLSRNIFSAVDQLAWERKLDYQQGQSLEKHVSQMTIPVYDTEDDLADNGALISDKKPPIDKRKRKSHKTPTGSPKSRRPHRNQVQPIVQEYSEGSPAHGGHDSQLVSIPSETTLDIVTLGEGERFVTKTSRLTNTVSSEAADSHAEVMAYPDSASGKAATNEGCADGERSVGSAVSRGSAISEGSSRSHDSPHRRKKKRRKEKKDRGGGTMVSQTSLNASLTSLIMAQGNVHCLNDNRGDTEDTPV
ncbi:transient receptor potential cation channel subfamily V member 5-like isoform X2 [Liolophura sinensis]